MKLRELLEGIDYKLVSGEAGLDRESVGVTDDSRECGLNYAYVCVCGKKNDGHKFVANAVESGATALICESGRGEEIRGITASKGDIAVVEVQDTRSALARMLGVLNGVFRSSAKIVCVTGTNGKTTVSTLIYRALCSLGHKAALLGTLGGEFMGKHYSCGTMTTPDPKILYGILGEFIKGGAEYIIMEASSHALALRKLDGLMVHIGVFTNLTPEHLDFHGSMGEYARAKARLFERCEYGGVFFADDSYAENMQLALACGRRCVRCSITEKSADYFADNVEILGLSGVKYTVIHGDFDRIGVAVNTRTEVYSGIPGSFSVCNSLLAFSVLCELGIPSVCASGGVAACRGVRGRMERLPVPESAGYSVFIDFAHTPDALSKVITAVRDFSKVGERIVLVFGCGGDRDRSKRSLMGAIASRLADLTVITADNSRSEATESIIEEILSGFDRSRPYKVITDRREAINYVLETAGAGDIILLCGKGHEEYEISGGTVQHFSEREIVAEFFADHGKV